MVAFTGRLRGPDGHEIAYDQIPPEPGSRRPGIIFLHGLASDRGGTKANALADHCAGRGLGFIRFDMYGHGGSTGGFEEAGPARWRDDALQVLDGLTDRPQILVGSSMGGWIMLLAALARPEKVVGLIGIAPAPDFTEDLMWHELSPADRATITAGGAVDIPNAYLGSLRIGPALFAQGQQHLLLRNALPITCPVRLLHGQGDTSVPWQRSLQLAERIVGTDVSVMLIKDGDHSLSRPQDLDLLCRTIDDLAGRLAS
jgi:pimeloyl-ACP methyl ester carboxylesterase